MSNSNVKEKPVQTSEHPEEISSSRLQERIAKLEKRVRRGRIAALLGIVAAVGIGLVGLHELKDKHYTPYDSAREITLISSLENQEKSKEFKIFEGEVNFKRGAKIYESPQDSSKLFSAQQYDNAESNIVDEEKVFNGLHSANFDDINLSKEFESDDCIHIYYPIVVKQKTATLDKTEGKTWLGFKQLIDGDYHSYWMNGDDVLSAIPEDKKHKSLSVYNGKLPFDLIGQASFDNTIVLN